MAFPKNYFLPSVEQGIVISGSRCNLIQSIDHLYNTVKDSLRQYQAQVAGRGCEGRVQDMAFPKNYFLPYPAIILLIATAPNLMRDARTRGSSAQRTIRMWQSVRRGEEKFIFPFQDPCRQAIHSTGG